MAASVTCEICSKGFKTNPNKARRNVRHFCSLPCLYNWRSLYGKFVKERNPRWKGGELKKKCLTCLKEFSFIRKRIKTAKFCSQSCAAKLRFKGAKNKKWKGGVSLHRDHVKSSLFYKSWRMKVFRRDWFKCQDCGYKGRDIEAHHIKKWTDFPRLTFKLWNGITLCKSCHDKTYGKEEKFEKRYFTKTLNDYTPSILKKFQVKI